MRLGPEHGGRRDWQVVDNAAVGQRPAQVLDRLDGPREAYRRPHRLDEVTLGDEDVLAVLDVGGGNRERQLQVSEGARQVTGEERLQAVALYQARLQGDVDDVTPTGVEGDVVDLVWALAGGVKGAEYGAHRGTGNDVELRAGALQHPKDADVREAARAASRQHEANAVMPSRTLHMRTLTRPSDGKVRPW